MLIIDEILTNVKREIVMRKNHKTKEKNQM